MAEVVFICRRVLDRCSGKVRNQQTSEAIEPCIAIQSWEEPLYIEDTCKTRKRERVEYLQDVCSSVSLDALQKLDELESGNNNDAHLKMRKQKGRCYSPYYVPRKTRKNVALYFVSADGSIIHRNIPYINDKSIYVLRPLSVHLMFPTDLILTIKR